METVEELLHSRKRRGPGPKAKCVRNCRHSHKGRWKHKHKRTLKACRRTCHVKAS